MLAVREVEALNNELNDSDVQNLKSVRTVDLAAENDGD